jgi:uncharacterized protein (TIRG00374 family)
MAVVTALLVHFLDLHATLAALTDMDPIALLLAFSFSLVDRFSMSYKWNILLETRGCLIPQWAAFRIYIASGFVGYVSPAGVGADVYRAARLAFMGRRASSVSATIVLERVLGLLAILMLSSVGLALVALQGRSEILPLLGATLVALSVGTVLTAMSMSSRLYRMLRQATERFSRNKIVKVLYSLHDEYVTLSQGGRPLLWFFLLSIVNPLIRVLMCVPVLMSLGVEVDWLALAAVLPLSRAFSMLMPVPAGVGVLEGTQVVALSIAHVPPAQGLAVALVMRGIDFAMLVPSGLAYAADTWRLRRTA